MTRNFRAFVVMAALCVLSACTTITTENPVGISGGAQTDAQLIGGWKVLQIGKDKPDGPTYVFFLPLKDGSLQAMVAGWEPSTGPRSVEGGWMNFEIIVGRAGENRMINARQLLEDGKPPASQPEGYLPLLYRFGADGNLQVFNILDSAALKDAVEKGRLAGAIGANGNDVKITAEPAALDAFFAAEASALFTDPLLSLQPLN